MQPVMAMVAATKLHNMTPSDISPKIRARQREVSRVRTLEAGPVSTRNAASLTRFQLFEAYGCRRYSAAMARASLWGGWTITPLQCASQAGLQA